MFSVVEEQTKAQPMIVTVQLNSLPFHMEVDTGASLSVASEAKLQQLLGNLDLKATTVTLKTYTGENLPVVGEIEVLIEYGSQSARLPLVVIQGDGPCLFGRNWMTNFDCIGKTSTKLLLENLGRWRTSWTSTQGCFETR